MSQLAIRGHKTRSKEVIEILEMLGGKNVHDYVCNIPGYAYIINKQGIIDLYIPHLNSSFAVFTLEEFFEKYPYKIGDRVQSKGGALNSEIYIIKSMEWNNFIGQIYYTIKTTDGIVNQYKWTAQEFMFHKEETIEGKNNDNWAKWDLPDGYEFQDKDENIINTSVIRLVKKQPQYPKTYEECCKILNWNHRDYDRVGYNSELLCKLQVLLLCRDAYWKIAGDWEPAWGKPDEMKYCIVNTEGNITKWVQKTTNKILAFPTEEMRDAFLENFKELIESCKELL